MKVLSVFFSSRLFLFLLITLLTPFFVGCYAPKQKASVTALALPGVALPGYSIPTRSQNLNNVNKILKTAFSQLGNPYRHGGNSPETGFDCSGFVSWVYKQYGVSLPRSSRDMLDVGVPVSKDELRPGDLVFFNYGYSHVGIYTGQDKFIHSPRTGKRIEEASLASSGRGIRYVGARRVIDNLGVTQISNNLKQVWIKQSRHQNSLAMNDLAALKHTGAKAAAKKATVKTKDEVKIASKGKKEKSSASSEKSNEPSSKKSASSKSNSKSSSYEVKSGDNLVTIAKRFGVTSTEIAQVNNLANKNSLKAGQKLTIPSKSADKSDKTVKSKSDQKSAANEKAKTKKTTDSVKKDKSSDKVGAKLKVKDKATDSKKS
ncbi:MAG: C40 family peptidase [Deltaproteobacteria bacterium]|jgi:LysM repeat protein|nr:C40 family peptidase [Deltaproteobacteria bacterium]